MAVLAAYKTDPGKVAQHNEDYIWVDDEHGVYIIADGMGGHEAGDVASQMAATTVGNTIVAGLQTELSSGTAIRALITEAIEQANQAVWAASAGAAQTRRMGATIVVAVVKPPVVHIAHAGDARIYVIRESTITRLTHDDSWVAQLVASGIISEAEGRHNRLSHIITKAVGQGAPVDANATTLKIKSGDILILCSDGLWNMVGDAQILVELQRVQGDPQKLVEALIRAANNAGGKDNISAIAVKIV